MLFYLQPSLPHLQSPHYGLPSQRERPASPFQNHIAGSARTGRRNPDRRIRIDEHLVVASERYDPRRNTVHGHHCSDFVDLEIYLSAALRKLPASRLVRVPRSACGHFASPQRAPGHRRRRRSRKPAAS